MYDLYTPEGPSSLAARLGAAYPRMGAVAIAALCGSRDYHDYGTPNGAADTGKATLAPMAFGR